MGDYTIRLGLSVRCSRCLWIQWRSAGSPHSLCPVCYSPHWEALWARSEREGSRLWAAIEGARAVAAARARGQGAGDRPAGPSEGGAAGG